MSHQKQFDHTHCRKGERFCQTKRSVRRGDSSDTSSNGRFNLLAIEIRQECCHKTIGATRDAKARNNNPFMTVTLVKSSMALL